jgi:hypothetical protein
MGSTYEKSVKGISENPTRFLAYFAFKQKLFSLWNRTDGFMIGATKVKLAAPKSKYIEHLLMATQVTFPIRGI